MHAWATDLFPICRSLTGEGVRTTLAYLGNLLPGLHVHSVATGTKAFDWVVPEEWIIRSGYVADMDGNVLIDFKYSNLHIVGYSIAVDLVVSREVLFEHLYSLPEQPGGFQDSCR
jgi:aminopeptidase-like protein